jgi:glycosyltransferase involved in cell wall biosynthesis
VIVSHLNSSRTIGECIAHLLRQDYPTTLFHITVVDGGSTDGSVGIVNQFRAPNLSQLIQPGCSEAEGQIRGVEAADTDVIMFTNSDVYVPNDWVSRHVVWLQSGYDLVGGKVFWGGDKYAFTWNMPRPKSPRHVQEEGLGLGFSNCSTTRVFFRRVGGVKDLSSQQDTEFAFRAVRQGGKMILDPQLEVYHDHPFGSFRASFIRAFGYGRNHVLVMRAAYGRIVAGSGAPAMMPPSALVKELTCVNGTKAYNEHLAVALSMGIQSSLVEFLFIRLFSTKLGQMVGALVGASKRGVGFGAVVNLHKRGKNAREMNISQVSPIPNLNSPKITR